MTKKTSKLTAKVLSIERVYRGFLNIDRATVRHTLYGGGERTVDRFCLEAGRQRCDAAS